MAAAPDLLAMDPAEPNGRRLIAVAEASPIRARVVLVCIDLTRRDRVAAPVDGGAGSPADFADALSGARLGTAFVSVHLA